jgi:hypothetical protein
MPVLTLNRAAGGRSEGGRTLSLSPSPAGRHAPPCSSSSSTITSSSPPSHSRLAPQMPAGSSPLSSPLSQVSTLSDLSDEDAPLETRDLGSPGPAGVDAAAGPSRSTRRSSAAKRVAADAAATGGGKRKRSTTPGSSAVKRPKTRTASSSLAVKAEQLASSSSVGDQLGQTQPPLPVQRRSARGSILPPTSPLKLASPPPLMRKKPTAVASKPVVDEPAVEPTPPPPTKRTTAKRPPPAAPAPLAVPEPPPPVAVEPTPGPARLPSSPPPVPVQQAPVVVANGKKAGRDSIASLMSAPPTVNASVSQASVPAASLPPPTAIAPSPPAEAAPSAPPPKLRSEPGVEWIAGRETCPMCRDAPTIPVQPNAQPRRQPDAAATDDDVTMAEGSMNALGLSAGQGAMQAASPATVVESSTVPDPAIIVDSWLSCVKCALSRVASSDRLIPVLTLHAALQASAGTTGSVSGRATRRRYPRACSRSAYRTARLLKRSIAGTARSRSGTSFVPPGSAVPALVARLANIHGGSLALPARRHLRRSQRSRSGRRAGLNRRRRTHPQTTTRTRPRRHCPRSTCPPDRPSRSRPPATSTTSTGASRSGRRCMRHTSSRVGSSMAATDGARPRTSSTSGRARMTTAGGEGAGSSSSTTCARRAARPTPSREARASRSSGSVVASLTAS